MTKQDALRNSIIYIALISLGLLIAFEVWWTPGAARFFGLLSIFFVFGGFLLLSIALTRLLVATDVDFGFSTLSSQMLFKSFKKKAGSSVTRKVSVIFIVLFLFLGGTTIYYFIRFINEYEDNQLEEHGVVQKVQIKDVTKTGRGFEYAAFDYYYNNKVYSNELELKDFDIGDSVEIIFSAKNPDIIQWAEDFNAENN